MRGSKRGLQGFGAKAAARSEPRRGTGGYSGGGGRVQRRWPLPSGPQASGPRWQLCAADPSIPFPVPRFSTGHRVTGGLTSHLSACALFGPHPGCHVRAVPSGGSRAPRLWPPVSPSCTPRGLPPRQALASCSPGLGTVPSSPGAVRVSSSHPPPAATPGAPGSLSGARPTWSRGSFHLSVY